jgi:hypothetical protein
LTYSSEFISVLFALATVCAIPAIVMLAYESNAAHPNPNLFALLIAALALPVVVVLLTPFRRASVPGNYVTLGALSTTLVGIGKSTWTTQEVWQVVRVLTAENAGIKARELKPETKFVELD